MPACVQVHEEQLLELSGVDAGGTFALRAGHGDGDGDSTAPLPVLGTSAAAIQAALEALPLLGDVGI